MQNPDRPIHHPQETRMTPEVSVVMHGASIPSVDHPDRNEDAIYFSPESKFAVLADGVGGLERGDIASRTTIRVIREQSEGIIDETQLLSAEFIMANALVNASSAVLNETEGGGSTAISTQLIGDRLIWASVGDSRLYLLRKGKLQQITIDDGPLVLVQKTDEEKKHIAQTLDEIVTLEDMLKTPTERTKDFMSDEDLATMLHEADEESGTEGETLEDVREMSLYFYLYTHGNFITEMIGSQDGVRPAHGMVEVQPGDAFILSSDGNHDNAKGSQIKKRVIAALRASEDPALALVNQAKSIADEGKGRAKHDDISVIVIQIGSKNEQIEASQD